MQTKPVSKEKALQFIELAKEVIKWSEENL